MPRLVYQWKKGDNLDKVAKANGLDGADAIWDDPANRAIAKSRKKPAQLQPGDKLVIPQDDAKIKRLEQAIKTLQTSIRMANNKIGSCDDLITNETRLTDSLVKELQDLQKDFQKNETIADVLSLVVSMGKSLAKISTAGLKAATAAAEELAEANKQMMEGLADLNKEPLEFVGSKALVAHKDSENKLLASVGKTVEKLENWLSPFWWGTAIVRKCHGASWSDTLMGSIDDDLDQQIKDLKKGSQERLAIYRTARQKTLDGLAILNSNLKSAQDQLKAARH
jgi:uncharacterized protein YoxC